MALFLALVVVFGFGNAAQAQLLNGSVDPVTAFPTWWQDSTGMQLQLCDEGGLVPEQPPCPGLTLAVPGNGVVAGNISEAMYYSATGIIDVPVTGELFLNIAMVEAANPPDEVFNTVLIRLRNLVQLVGNYTVTTPWGNIVIPGDGVSTDIRVFLPAAGAVAGPAYGPLNGPITVFSAGGGAVAGAFLGDGVTPGLLNPVPAGGADFTVQMPDGTTVTTNQFAVEGKIFAQFPPSATYTRDALGAGNVTVRFSGPTTATTTVVGDVTALPGEPVALAELTPGVFEAVIPILAGDLLPASVSITSNLAGNIRNANAVPLTDLVVITSADFNTDTLTVVADSGDDFSVPLPVLTVTDGLGAPLGTIDTAVANTLSVATPMPAEVIVTSSGGGVARLAVTDLTPGAGDPNAPAGVGGGGGSSGGCFISELLN
jgi:hypothetical protein